MDTPASNPPTPFGICLKHWRITRQRTQLDLSLDAGVSQRHLSFLESGRAKPSREMVLQLAETLNVPLRERNGMLHAAGFAPVFERRGLEHADMRMVRNALSMTLAHHEPYPAMVVNRAWDIVMTNHTTDRFIALLGDPAELWRKVDPSGGRNAMRLSFHAEGFRPHIRNWPEVSLGLVTRLQRELAADPSNEALRQLLTDVTDWTSGQDARPMRPLHSGTVDHALPVFPVEYAMGTGVLKVFSMLSSFGTALDVTADELRIETFFPADDFTESFFRMLGQANPPASA